MIDSKVWDSMREHTWEMKIKLTLGEGNVKNELQVSEGSCPLLESVNQGCIALARTHKFMCAGESTGGQWPSV